MKSLTLEEAERLFTRWKSKLIVVRMISRASDGATHEGMITDIETSPGHIAVRLLVRSGEFGTSDVERNLALKDCEFFGTESELEVRFTDGRGLRFMRPTCT